MGRINRQLYRRNMEFTVVRPVRIAKNAKLEPGDEIDKGDFREFHLRSLYQRRRIGARGAPWTLAMLQDLGNAHARPELTLNNGDDPVVEPIKPVGDAEQVIGNVTMAIEELMALAMSAEGLDAEAWNAITGAEREAHMISAAERVMEAQENGSEASEEDVTELGEASTDQDDTQTEEVKASDPVVPVKVGSQWVIEGVTERKFTSRKKALEFMERQAETKAEEAPAEEAPAEEAPAEEAPVKDELDDFLG